MNMLHRLFVTVIQSLSVNRDQNHVVNGDLCFIENKHLRSFISKGQNFRERRVMKWNRSKYGINRF